MNNHAHCIGINFRIRKQSSVIGHYLHVTLFSRDNILASGVFFLTAILSELKIKQCNNLPSDELHNVA